MQWLRFTRGKEYAIQYKYTLNEEMPLNDINLKPTKLGRRVTLTLFELDKLYDGPN